MTKEDYCLGHDGQIRTKCSEVLSLMGYSIGQRLHGSITMSERFIYLIGTNEFKEVPEEMWQKHLENYEN
jgi:hypothetical protein